MFRPLGGAGTPAGLLSVAALWLWAGGRMVPGGGLATGRQPARPLILLLLVSTLASYAAAYSRALPPPEARGADRFLILMAAGAGVVLLAADGIRTRALLDKLLRRLAALVTVVAVIGLVQYTTGFDVAGRVSIPGLSRAQPGSFIATRYIFRRVSGTTAHGIEFSSVLAMAFPLALHYAFYSQGFRRRLWWMATALLAVGIPMSLSRTGVVGLFVIGLMLIPTWDRARRRWAFIVAGVFCVAMKLVFPGLLGTVKGLFLNFGNDTSIDARQVDYGYIGRFFAKAPLVGRGMGTFLPEIYKFLDNQYLMTAVEGGILGLVAVFALYLVGMGMARGARMRSSDQETRELGQALAASISVALVTSATFDFLGFATARGFMFMLVGCAGALWRLVREDQAREATGASVAAVGPT